MGLGGLQKEEGLAPAGVGPQLVQAFNHDFLLDMAALSLLG
jgi:hypothetical protein